MKDSKTMVVVFILKLISLDGKLMVENNLNGLKLITLFFFMVGVMKFKSLKEMALLVHLTIHVIVEILWIVNANAKESSFGSWSIVGETHGVNRVPLEWKEELIYLV